MSRKKRKEKYETAREDEQRNKPIVAKTENQKKLLKSFEENIISVASGDAGSGKSYLAGHWAAQQLRLGKTEKVIITRPYVTMGRSTGLWPGTVEEKLKFFLLPILNNIADQLGTTADYELKKGNVQIHPLEAIRGMSFENCIVIVEEFQNTTPEEVKSIVTRLGDNTKLLITCDKKQSDIKGYSGAQYLEDIVDKYNIGDVGIINFTHHDIVRSGIVKEFVMAFDKEGEQS